MSGEPKVGHNKFLSDHATGVRVDHSQSEGDHFDLSAFDHMFTPEELAEIKRNRADG
jgi:hypothetical protein